MSEFDEHYSELMATTGNPYVMENGPFADTPDWGGWGKYFARHAHDDQEQRDWACTLLELSGHKVPNGFREIKT